LLKQEEGAGEVAEKEQDEDDEEGRQTCNYFYAWLQILTTN